MSILTRIFGSSSDRFKKEVSPHILRIAGFEEAMKNLADGGLKEKTLEFRGRITNGETLDDILPEAFALVREAARRTLKERHYDVQLVGGIALHQGKIAEMKTGEGKTLVATLPAYLNALSGKGVHVVTVNDYLARRDAVWMGQVYALLGISVSVLNHETSYLYDEGHREEESLDRERDEKGSFRVYYEYLRPTSRREAYAADITYGTNHEFGFDYLRDNLAYNSLGLVQREDTPHNFAIVDEVDSILIDEARTPLIISAPISESESLYGTFAHIASKLIKDTDYTVDEKFRSISLTESGIEKAEKTLGVENIYTDRGIKYVHHLETAVRARALYALDKDYVVKDGEIVIVDQSTGRLQPGRRWSEGLHQAIEAKEGVRVKEESRTFASVSFQNYFRLYSKLAGMTGTALTSREEFEKVYRLDTVEIPTHKPNIRKDYNDLIFQTEGGKWTALSRAIKEANERGQPVLLGTVSIEKNEMLSAYLKKEGVRHEILNAKNHEREGEIIAQAGRRGAVTIATNMAGRGVDIKLGGSPSSNEEYEEVKSLGGLYVIGTERHEARRIDNQLRGRSARQGDPGATQFFLSLEDSLMRVFAADMIKNMMGRFGIPEDEPIETRMVNRAIESAQEKIEGFNFDARKHLLEYDDVLNYQRKIMYERRRKVLLGDQASLQKFFQDIGCEAPSEIETGRQLVLQVIDMFWVEHLEAMDYLQSSVRLRAYGQRDPLVEYKREGLQLFKQMEQHVFSEIARLLPTIGAAELKKEDQKYEEVHRQASLISGETGNVEDKRATVDAHEEKVGRNDPCPCGAKKADRTAVKYKRCHGA